MKRHSIKVEFYGCQYSMMIHSDITNKNKLTAVESSRVD